MITERKSLLASAEICDEQSASLRGAVLLRLQDRGFLEDWAALSIVLYGMKVAKE